MFSFEKVSCFHLCFWSSKLTMSQRRHSLLLPSKVSSSPTSKTTRSIPRPSTSPQFPRYRETKLPPKPLNPAPPPSKPSPPLPRPPSPLPFPSQPPKPNPHMLLNLPPYPSSKAMVPCSNHRPNPSSSPSLRLNTSSRSSNTSSNHTSSFNSMSQILYPTLSWNKSLSSCLPVRIRV